MFSSVAPQPIRYVETKRKRQTRLRFGCNPLFAKHEKKRTLQVQKEDSDLSVTHYISVSGKIGAQTKEKQCEMIQTILR
jgi:hypothetical protein